MQSPTLLFHGPVLGKESWNEFCLINYIHASFYINDNNNKQTKPQFQNFEVSYEFSFTLLIIDMSFFPSTNVIFCFPLLILSQCISRSLLNIIEPFQVGTELELEVRKAVLLLIVCSCSCLQLYCLTAKSFFLINYLFIFVFYLCVCYQVRTK